MANITVRELKELLNTLKDDLEITLYTTGGTERVAIFADETVVEFCPAEGSDIVSIKQGALK